MPTVKDAPPPGVPALPKVQTQLCPTKEPGVGVLVDSQICTASRKAAGFVRHVCIDISGTAMAGRFRPGQSFGVLAPGLDARGRPHGQRLYSIASPTRGERVANVDGPPGSIIATTCKRTIDEHWDTHRLLLGVCSNYLCDAQVGDEIRVTGPAGKRFLLPDDPSKHDYVFFATGTGIAPFRGMVLDLLESGAESRVVLIMGVPYATDLLYHQELEALAQAHANFHYVTAVSREAQADVPQRLYVQDRVATHRDLMLDVLGSERTLVYLCGLVGMELGIFRAMLETLPDDMLDQYLRLDDDARADPGSWDRKAIGRRVRPTRRVFVEVY